MDFYELPNERHTDDVRIEQSVKEQKEYKLIGHSRRVPGHTLFSYNTVTGEMKPADVERRVFMLYAGEVGHQVRVNVEPNCIYGQALNLKNWEKKIRKLFDI